MVVISNSGGASAHVRLVPVAEFYNTECLKEQENTRHTYIFLATLFPGACTLCPEVI